MGARIAIEGLRSAGEGIESFGQARRQSQLRQDDQDELERKRASKIAFNERLADQTQEQDALIAKITDNPDITHDEVSAEMAGLEAGRIGGDDPSSARTKSNIEGIMARRAKVIEDAKPDPEADTKNFRFKQKSRRELQGIHGRKQTTKDTTDSIASYNTLKDAISRQTPAGDMAAITTFNRTVEPGGRVTDADFRNAETARSAATRVESWYNSAENTKGLILPTAVIQFLNRWTPTDNEGAGTELLQGQRDDFLATSRKMFRSKLVAQEKVDNATLREAELSKLAPENVLSKELRARTLLDELDKEDADKAAKAEVKKEEAEQVRVIGDEILDKFIADNKPEFDKRVAGINQDRMIRGQRPMSQEEIHDIVRKLLKKNKLKHVSGGK